MTYSGSVATTGTSPPLALTSTLAGDLLNQQASSMTMEWPEKSTGSSQQTANSSCCTHIAGDYSSCLQQQGELRSLLRRTSLYRRGGSEVRRNGSSERRYALESDSRCVQWTATTPTEMTSRTPIGTNPNTELRQGNLKKSTCRMTAPVCVEKWDVDGVGTSTTRSTVATPISDALAKEVAMSLQPMFFMPPSTNAQPQKIGKVTESCNRDKPMPSGHEGLPDLWNPFKEPFSQW